MKVIYKYKLDQVETQVIRMCILSPLGVLSVGHDPQGDLCMWAMVDVSNQPQDVTVRIYGTGMTLPIRGTFIGTVLHGRFVWHVFAEIIGNIHDGEVEP